MVSYVEAFPVFLVLVWLSYGALCAKFLEWFECMVWSHPETEVRLQTQAVKT
jgi:hypothetical protein